MRSPATVTTVKTGLLVPPAVKVIIAGLMSAAKVVIVLVSRLDVSRPVATMDTVRVTVPAKLFRLARLMEEVPIEPLGTDTVSGTATMLKSGVPTVRAILAMWDDIPLVPVTVMV